MDPVIFAAARHSYRTSLKGRNKTFINHTGHDLWLISAPPFEILTRLKDGGSVCLDMEVREIKNGDTVYCDRSNEIRHDCDLEMRLEGEDLILETR